MNQRKKNIHPVRRLVSLGIITLLLYSVTFVGFLTGHASLVPGLALDLAGGTQIILSPQHGDGQVVDDVALEQAIDVIRQRIDSSGVSEAEITKQGTENIVVGIPGETPSQETIDFISQSAKMKFRPVIFTESGVDTSMYEKMGLSASQAKNAAGGSDDDLKKILDDKDKIKNDKAKGTSSGYQWLTAKLVDAYKKFDCSKEENRDGKKVHASDKPLITCAREGVNGKYQKYLLGPVAFEGTGINNASSGLKQTQTGQSTNEWVVSITLKSDANKIFIDVTNRIKTLDSPRNQFAITLDDTVISAPKVDSGTTFAEGQGIEISGGASNGFTKTEATNLANQLKYGSLPVSFTLDSKEQISATLGTEQLQKGLIAGLIGLLLVILYSIYQYHTLGLVTIGSLVIASIMAYGSILLLSWVQGYRLSLSGVIALIVAIGVTSDSFIVFFERIRDELRDGRPLSTAVSRGWHRGFRTILSANSVNFIAAVVLYFVAVGDVRGFAFTLGLTTIIDFIVVILFTCPTIALLSRVPFFYEGHPASGLSPHRLGAVNAVEWKKKTKEEKLADKKARKEAIKHDKEVAKNRKEIEKQKASINKEKVAEQKKLKKENKKTIKLQKKRKREREKAAKLAQKGKSNKSLFSKKADKAVKNIKVTSLFGAKKPATEKATKPVAAKKSTKPAAKKPAAKTSAKKPAAKSVTKKPATKKTAKPAAKKSANKTNAKEVK